MYCKANSDKLCIRRSRIPDAGLGVFAKRNLKAGELLENVPFIEVPSIVVYSQPNILQHYVFNSHNDDGNVIIAFGYGSMYNHSPTEPNVQYYINKKDRRRLLDFRALYDIPEGAELLINYGRKRP